MYRLEDDDVTPRCSEATATGVCLDLPRDAVSGTGVTDPEGDEVVGMGRWRFSPFGLLLLRLPGWSPWEEKLDD